MADTNKITYVSLENLEYYDEKIKSHIQAKDDALNTAISNESTRAQAAEATNALAAENAQKAADAAQSGVDALETLVGALPEGTTAKDVVDYVNIKTSGIATDAALGELQGQLNGVQGEVNTIKGDYLKSADKTELSGAINVEKERAMGVEGGLETRLAAVEGDYLKGEDKTELNNLIKANSDAIDAIELDYLKKADKDEVLAAVNTEKERAMGVEGGLEDRIETMEAFWAAAEADGTDVNVIDTLKEIQEYIATDESGASAMAASIKQNSDDIDALEGKMNVVETKLGTVAEGAQVNVIENVKVNGEALTVTDKAVDIVIPTGALAGKDKVAESDLETALATKINGKADQTALDSVVEDIEALQGVDESLDGRLKLVEAQLGDGENSVSDLIATAKQEAIDAAGVAADEKDVEILAQAKKYADDEDAKIEARVDALETASDTYALIADLEALIERVTTAEGEIDTLQTEMDAVEALAAANKAAHEANAQAIALKASQVDLEAEVTRATNREAELQAEIDAFVECTTDEIDSLFV